MIWMGVIFMALNTKFLTLKFTSTKTSLRVVHVCFGLILGFWLCRNFCSLSCVSDSISRDSVNFSFCKHFMREIPLFCLWFWHLQPCPSSYSQFSQHLVLKIPFSLFIQFPLPQKSVKKFEVFEPEYSASCSKGTGLLEYPCCLILSNLIWFFESFPKWAYQTWTNP